VRLAKRSKLEETQLIRRAKILQNPLLSGIALHRELLSCYLPVRTRDARLQAYGSGLRETSFFHESHVPRETIGFFDWNEKQRTFYYGVTAGRDLHYIGLASLATDPKGRGVSRSRAPENIDSNINSLSVSPAGVVAATESGSIHGGNPSLHLVSYADYEWTSRRSGPGLVSLSMSHDISLFCSRANPFLTASESLFAIGMTSGVRLYGASQPQWTIDYMFDLDHDPLSVDWLGPTSLAMGQRGGYITLGDTRSYGSALRLRHPSNVYGLRCVDSNLIVACGIQDSLAMYDMRMPRVGYSRNTLPPSQPVVKYAYKNKYLPNLGFDVCARNGLVAAVDDNAVIQLYSLHTGAVISSDVTGGSEDANGKRLMVSMKFVEIDGIDRLVVSRDGELVEMRW